MEQISAPILLLVEGVTDKAFIEKLLALHMLVSHKTKFDVEAIGGYDNLKPFIKGFNDRPNAANVKVLAAIVDADEHPQLRNTDVDTLLQTVRTKELLTDHLLLPDNQTSGALESLVLKTLSRKDLACASQYVGCAASISALNQAQTDKLSLYAWTSQQQKEPTNNFMRPKVDGARSIDFQHEAFASIKDFLLKLANYV